MKIKTPFRIPVKTIFCPLNFLLICAAIHLTWNVQIQRMNGRIFRMFFASSDEFLLSSFWQFVRAEKFVKIVHKRSALMWFELTQSWISVDVSRSFHVFRSVLVTSGRPGKKNSSLTSLNFQGLTGWYLRYQKMWTKSSIFFTKGLAKTNRIRRPVKNSVLSLETFLGGVDKVVALISSRAEILSFLKSVTADFASTSAAEAVTVGLRKFAKNK